MASSWWTTRSIYPVTCQVKRLNSFSSCCDPKYSTSRCCSAPVHGCETGWGAAFGRYLLQISLTAYNTCVMLFTCIYFYLYIYICNLRLYNNINTYLGRVCTYLGTHMSLELLALDSSKRSFPTKNMIFLRFLGILQYILEYGIWPFANISKKSVYFGKKSDVTDVDVFQPWTFWPIQFDKLMMNKWSCTKGNLGNAHLEALGLKQKWSFWRRT